MDIPNIAELEQEAARLRTQADRLNRAHADRQERNVAEGGSRVDTSRRDAVAARAAAESAAERAIHQREQANQASRQASELEAKAAKELAKADAISAETAAEYHEQAQVFSGRAAGYTSRAEESEKSAREQFDRADRYNREADELLETANGRTFELARMHEVADLLDQKAFGLEQAAQRYREAVQKIDAPDYEKAVEDAAIYHRAADNITIDYSGIDTDALIDLGMTQPRVADDPVAGHFDPGSSGVAQAASDTSTAADADTWFAAAADTPADDAQMPEPALEPTVDVLAEPDPTMVAFAEPAVDDATDFGVDEPAEHTPVDDASFEFQV